MKRLKILIISTFFMFVLFIGLNTVTVHAEELPQDEQQEVVDVIGVYEYKEDGKGYSKFTLYSNGTCYVEATDYTLNETKNTTGTFTMADNLIKVNIGTEIFTFELVESNQLKPVEETEPVKVEEKKPTFSEMLTDFIQKFLPSIMGGTSAGVTLFFVYWLFRKSIKKMVERIVSSAMLTEDEKKSSTEKLNKAEQILESATNELAKKMENVDEVMERFNQMYDSFENKFNDLFNKMQISEEKKSKLFEIIAVLVVKNVQLCDDGTATKILELMDEGADTNEQKENKSV